MSTPATTALLLIDVQASFRARPYWSEAEAPAFFERTNALLAGAQSRSSTRMGPRVRTTPSPMPAG